MNLEHVMEETSANILNVIEILQEKFIILTGKFLKNFFFFSLVLFITSNLE